MPGNAVYVAGVAAVSSTSVLLPLSVDNANFRLGLPFLVRALLLFLPGT